MYMNKQTSEMLKILLSSPGQHFTCEALAEYLHVSTRTIRNYMTTIRDFMNQNGKEDLLQQSDGGICVTGTAEELQMLSRASVDHEFYLHRLAPTERFVMILITLLMSDTYCTLNDLAEKFKVSRGTILKDMEKVRRYLEHQGISFGSLMNKGYSLDIHENERRSLLVRLVQGTLESAYMGEEQENIYWKYLRDEYELEIYRREVKTLLLEEERNQKLNVSDSCFEEVQFTIVISLARMKHGHLIDRMDKEQPFTGMYPVFEMAERLCSRLHAIFHFPYTEQEELFLAHALYECRFYKDGAADRARDMQMHVAVTGFLTQVGKELSLPLCEDMQAADQLEKHLKDIAKAHREGIHFQNEYREPMQKAYPVYYEAVKRNIYMLERGIGYSCSEDDLTFILFHVVAIAERYYQSYQKPGVVVVCHTGIGTACFLAEQLKNNFNIRIVAITSRHKLEETMNLYDFDLVVSTVTLNLQGITWIKVSPMLEDNDILALQKIFLNLRKQKWKHKNNSMTEPVAEAEDVFVLEPQNISMDAACRDWQSAIDAAGGLLQKQGVITAEYIQGMKEAVEKYGPYCVFCPGVALVHASPENGVNRFGVSLVKLKEPVRFGHESNDPVIWVICLASEERNPRLQRLLGIMNLMSDPQARKELDKLTTAQEVLQYLIERKMEE